MVSTTINQAREAIYQRFVDNTTLADYTFGNEAYEPPVDTQWARLTVLHELGRQDTLGPVNSRKFLRRGRVLIQLFDQEDQGIKNLDDLAALTRNIFEGVQFSGLFFRDVDVRETGPDGEWYQLVVDAPFFYEETK
jgi:hypothetical protein